MASARGLYRLGLTVAGLGAAALTLAAWVSLGAVNLSPPPLGVLIAACERFLSPDVSPRALFTLSLATPGLAAIALGSRSLLRELRAQRRLAARLEVTGKVDVDGSEVLVLDDHRARAFLTQSCMVAMVSLPAFLAVGALLAARPMLSSR